jgi:hypothetical protein
MNFNILDETNTARLSMTDPRTDCSITSDVLCGDDTRSLAYALMCFAQLRGIMPAEVEYSIQYPERRVQS